MEFSKLNYEKVKSEFNKCTTNLERINFFHNVWTTNYETAESDYEFAKSDDKAIKTRETGNLYFKQRLYLEALRSYTESIALAASPEVASLAYSNRSIVLDKIGLYKESISDMDEALKHGYPKELEVKLTTRRCNVSKKQNSQKSTQKFYPNEFISKNIKISENSKYGRHVVATEDIEIGTVLIIEKPIAAILTEDYLIYCEECLELCYNLLPCDTCTKVLYCSNNCKQKASKNYHKYECRILDDLKPLNVLEFNVSLAIKITLQSLNQVNAGISTPLNEIRKLKTHDSVPSRQRNIFIISYICAFLHTVFKEKTSLFSDYENCEDLFKETLFHSFLIQNVNGVNVNRLEPDVSGHKTVPYGRGVYLFFSVFNHSCFPNAFYYHEGSKIVVRTLGTVKKGQQCLISYGFTYCSHEKAKRDLLANQYYFVCKCRACEENWPMDETKNDDFSTPFAAVLQAQIQFDHELLRTMVPIFINRLRSLEKRAPIRGFSSLRQLVVLCYQIYQSTSRFFGE